MKIELVEEKLLVNCLELLNQIPFGIKNEVEKALQQQAQLFIAGDMGIANTTSATALACAYLNKSAADVAGAGTGLDEKGIAMYHSMLQTECQNRIVIIASNDKTEFGQCNEVIDIAQYK